MKISEVRDLLIPAISTFCNAPIIEADQVGDTPPGDHATYKFTMPYGKDVGQPDEIATPTVDGMNLEYVESYKTTLSITAYSMDGDKSHDLAQQIHDWFGFHGRSVMSNNNIVVVGKSDVANRDAIIIDEYERRNGFDVIMRINRKLVQPIDYFDRVEINNQ